VNNVSLSYLKYKPFRTDDQQHLPNDSKIVGIWDLEQAFCNIKEIIELIPLKIISRRNLKSLQRLKEASGTQTQIPRKGLG
jgi:hypothetical protein